MESLEKQVATLLMDRDFLDTCYIGGQRKLPPQELAKKCLENRENINIYLNWSKTTDNLLSSRVVIDREWFSDYCNFPNLFGAIFFTSVFTQMLFKAKPLEEYL